MQPRLSKYVILKTTLQNVNYKINVTQQNVNICNGNTGGINNVQKLKRDIKFHTTRINTHGLSRLT